MAISEFEIKRCEKHVGEYIAKHRPPVHIRNEVDLCFRIEDQSIVIFEIRSLFNKVDEKIESMVAKTTYIKKTKTWKIFWHKSDMKWHAYQPQPEVKTLEEFITILEKDEHCCFYG